MNKILIVVLMGVSCVLINPFVSASEAKDVAAVEQTQLDDLDDEFDENEEIEDEEE